MTASDPPEPPTGSPLPDLIRALGADCVVTDPALIQGYRFDWTRDASAGMPIAVARPRDASGVQAAVRWAARHGVALVPRGAGTGLSGGSLAVAGGLTLSLDRMTGVRVDPATQTAEVEPGALNAHVKAAAAAHGLWYPPDPSSYEICSIGGNIATNAGGLCCMKYGVTTDYVLGLDVVLADGTLVTLGGRRIKDVAGLPLVKLFVGSEGTLGIITRAILRLVPAQSSVGTVVATFPDVTSAARAVVEVGASMRPSMMELMDRGAINAVQDWRDFGLNRAAGALLVAQSDAPGTARADEIATMSRVFEANGALETYSTVDPAEGELMVAARRAFFHAMEPRGSILFEDVGVPIPALPALLARIGEIAETHEVQIPVVAHAGDGNTHPNVVYDARDPDSTRRAHLAFDDVMAAALELGGTITGEHGVGRLKRDRLPDQLGPDVMELTRRIKAALDPQGILNPGAGF